MSLGLLRTCVDCGGETLVKTTSSLASYPHPRCLPCAASRRQRSQRVHAALPLIERIGDVLRRVRGAVEGQGVRMDAVQRDIDRLDEEWALYVNTVMGELIEQREEKKT